MLKKSRKWWIIGIAVALVASLVLALLPAGVSITGEGNLSLETRVALAVQQDTMGDDSPVRYAGETIVEETSWGYLYTLENGDVVEVGDSSTADFKARVKTIRWNGVADFSLWLESGTFVPTLTDNTVSFDFNSSISVQIYPVPPSERTPEGGIEYNITLSKKLAKPTVTFSTDWTGITWTKLLALDVEYDQAACEEEWGIELAPFTITPTSITSDVTSEVLIARAEYDVNSYKGMATSNWHDTKEMGGGVTYSNVSRSYIHIHRGEMTDALNDKAWVEDIVLNEVSREITFILPTEWMKNAAYPVSQVCGVDPAYTEDIDSWDSSTYGSDNTWSDYDLFTNKGVPKGAVAEVIMSNQEPGVEALTGIRADGGSLNRYIDLHEAEGGGVTTGRMFVVCHLTTGLIETYSEDISDANLFYLAGYWENVSFTENINNDPPSSYDSWVDVTVDGSVASRVHHFVFRNGSGSNGQNVSRIMGVRANGSGLERKVIVHESESGGSSCIDLLVKSDGSGLIEGYLQTSDIYYQYSNMGYFGAEMDFVELFQAVTHAGDSAWAASDLTAYLDEDGRVVDFLLTHSVINSPHTLGARDGDDSSTARYIQEHEAEDDGSTTGEITGFGISAQSNTTGVVNLYSTTASEAFYLMGYFKPVAAGDADISNAPTSKAFGTVATSTNYWSNGSAPTFPLDDAECYFTVTNNGGTCSITIVATNFTGGVGWTLGVPAENVVRLKAGKSGDALETNMVTLTTSPQAFISALAGSGTKKWEIKMETPTSNTDGASKTSTITLAATLD